MARRVVSSRRKRTKKQLKAMSKHLAYEVQMLAWLERTLPATDDDLLNNALLESFVMHTRVLLDFFFLSTTRDSDIVASDYFESVERWETVRGELPSELANVRQRVGKEMAHLTLERLDVTSDKKPWNFAAIAGAIGSVLERFASAVDPELLDPLATQRLLQK